MNGEPLPSGFVYICLRPDCEFVNINEHPAVEHTKLGHGHAVYQETRQNWLARQKRKREQND